MAKVSYNDVTATGNTNGAGNSDFGVKFFKLGDGEDAIVRIILDSAEDLDIRTVHNVKVEGFQYNKNVNCIMEGGNPATCPLCARGFKLDQRIYLRMVQYVVDTNGVTAVPVVWERSRFDKIFGAQAIANYIKDYGSLSDVLVRISRRGTGLNTVYSATFGLNIMPNTKSVYRDDVYVKNTTLFGDFDILGVGLLNKSAEEMEFYAQNGTFPARDSMATPKEPPVSVPPTNSAYGNSYAPSEPVTSGYAPSTSENTYIPPVSVPPSTPGTPPITVATPRKSPQWGDNSPAGGFNRPTRY